MEFMNSFRLPGANDKNDQLAKVHPLPRDDRIQFFEADHTYVVDGVVWKLSVSGLVKQFVHEFDADIAIATMKAGSRWPRTEYMHPDGAEFSEDEIKQTWASNGCVQRCRGTLMHWHIEQFYNGRPLESPWSAEYLLFVRFHQDVLVAKGWRPFRTELSMFHCGLGVAGQADLLCVDEDGCVVIVDWKRSKNITQHGWSYMKTPLEHLPDANYYHYALQLNIYRHILETEYKMTVSAMVLGVFHPNQNSPGVLEICRMDQEIAAIVEYVSSAFLPGCKRAMPQTSTPTPSQNTDPNTKNDAVKRRRSK